MSNPNPNGGARQDANNAASSSTPFAQPYPLQPSDSLSSIISQTTVGADPSLSSTTTLNHDAFGSQQSDNHPVPSPASNVSNAPLTFAAPDPHEIWQLAFPSSVPRSPFDPPLDPQLVNFLAYHLLCTGTHPDDVPPLFQPEFHRLRNLAWLQSQPNTSAVGQILMQAPTPAPLAPHPPDLPLAPGQPQLTFQSDHFTYGQQDSVGVGNHSLAPTLASMRSEAQTQAVDNRDLPTPSPNSDPRSQQSFPLSASSGPSPSPSASPFQSLFESALAASIQGLPPSILSPTNGLASNLSSHLHFQFHAQGTPSPAGSQRSQNLSQWSQSPASSNPRDKQNQFALSTDVPMVPASSPRAAVPSRKMPGPRDPQIHCPCDIETKEPVDLENVPQFSKLPCGPRARDGEMKGAVVIAWETKEELEVFECKCQGAALVKGRESHPLTEAHQNEAAKFRTLFDNKLRPQQVLLPEDPAECARIDDYSKRKDNNPHRMTIFNERGEPVPFDEVWEGTLSLTCFPYCKSVPIRLVETNDNPPHLCAEKTRLLFEHMRKTVKVAKSHLSDYILRNRLKDDPDVNTIFTSNMDKLFFSAPLYVQGSKKGKYFCLVKVKLGTLGTKRRADSAANGETEPKRRGNGPSSKGGKGNDNKRQKPTPKSNQGAKGSGKPTPSSFEHDAGGSDADPQDTEMTASERGDEKQSKSTATEVWQQLDTTLLYEPNSLLRLRREIKSPSVSDFASTKIHDVTSTHKSRYQLDLWGPSNLKVTVEPSKVIHVIDEAATDQICCIDVHFELSSAKQADACFERAVEHGWVTKALFLAQYRENEASEWQKLEVARPHHSSDPLPHVYFVHEDDSDEFDESEFVPSREWGPGVDLLPLISDLNCEATDERITAVRSLVKYRALTDFDILHDRDKVWRAVQQYLHPMTSTLCDTPMLTLPQTLGQRESQNPPAAENQTPVFSIEKPAQTDTDDPVSASLRSVSGSGSQSDESPMLAGQTPTAIPQDQDILIITPKASHTSATLLSVPNPEPSRASSPCTTESDGDSAGDHSTGSREASISGVGLTG